MRMFSGWRNRRLGHPLRLIGKADHPGTYPAGSCATGHTRSRRGTARIGSPLMLPETSMVKTISSGCRGRLLIVSGGTSMSVKYPPCPRGSRCTITVLLSVRPATLYRSTKSLFGIESLEVSSTVAPDDSLPGHVGGNTMIRVFPSARSARPHSPARRREISCPFRCVGWRYETSVGWPEVPAAHRHRATSLRPAGRVVARADDHGEMPFVPAVGIGQGVVVLDVDVDLLARFDVGDASA